MYYIIILISKCLKENKKKFESLILAPFNREFNGVYFSIF